MRNILNGVVNDGEGVEWEEVDVNEWGMLNEGRLVVGKEDFLWGLVMVGGSEG